MKHTDSSIGVTLPPVSTLPGKMIRGLIALPLLLCALIGFLVAAPLWLGGRVSEMLGFDRSYSVNRKR